MPCGSVYSFSGDSTPTPVQSFVDATSDYASPDYSDCPNEFVCWIKNHPVAAIAIAVGIGLLLGRR